MKRDRKSKNPNAELYWAFDNEYGYNCSDEDKQKASDILAKHNVKDGMTDTRCYGLFFCEKDGKKRIKIDPKRFRKRFHLSDQQMDIMAKRNTTYFFSKVENCYDYNCNKFLSELSEIESEWKKDFKPMIDAAIKRIKEEKELTPGDYDNLMMGISGHGAAVAWTNWHNMKNQQKTFYKIIKLFTSLYSQFFHFMVSKIEAVTLLVFTENGYEGDRFDRNVLYAFKGRRQNNSDEKIKELKHFGSYEKMYSIWNFIKHNSLSTYNTLKEKFPNVLREVEYSQGEQAIFYVQLGEELIVEILNGVKEFFKEYCELVFHENYDEAQWNYDKHFLSQVNNEIEGITNPLGLGWWDDCD